MSREIEPIQREVRYTYKYSTKSAEWTYDTLNNIVGLWVKDSPNMTTKYIQYGKWCKNWSKHRERIVRIAS